jgi:hypothetical protein
MMADPRNTYYFSIWSDVQGFVTYTIRTVPEISIWDAFTRIVAESQGGEYPIPLTYRGEKIRWTFAYGPEGEAPEYIDSDLTFAELGIPDQATITIGPIDILGAGSLARIRYDRRQLIDFIRRNEDLLEVVNSSPTLFHLRIKGIRGVVGIEESGAPICTMEHEFAIVLGGDYPFSEPVVKPVSVIFHPNVSMRERKICAWVDYRPDQNQLLPWICFQVVDLITYRKVTKEAPHRLMNEDATRWYEEQEVKNPDLFPFSRKTFRPLQQTCRVCGRPLPPGRAACPHCDR